MKAPSSDFHHVVQGRSRRRWEGDEQEEEHGKEKEEPNTARSLELGTINQEQSPFLPKSVGGARHQKGNGMHANLRNDRAPSDLEVNLISATWL